MTDKKIIQVRNLNKKFGDFYANKNLSFDVYEGEIFGFLGANGAGKTTAIKILCGLSQPTSGEIEVAGFDVYTETEAIKRNIGYMSQKFSLYEDLTVWENLRLYAGIYGVRGKEFRNKARTLLEQLDFMHARSKLIKNIPTGWRQKLSFLSAVFHNPKIVFLDEPTGGVDPVTRRQFWDMIYEKADSGMTVFVTTHYMDEAEYCNRVSIMDKGEIVAVGNPLDLMEKYKAQNMDEVFVSIAR